MTGWRGKKEKKAMVDGGEGEIKSNALQNRQMISYSIRFYLFLFFFFFFCFFFFFFLFFERWIFIYIPISNLWINLSRSLNAIYIRFIRKENNNISRIYDTDASLSIYSFLSFVSLISSRSSFDYLRTSKASSISTENKLLWQKRDEEEGEEIMMSHRITESTNTQIRKKSIGECDCWTINKSTTAKHRITTQT